MIEVDRVDLETPHVTVTGDLEGWLADADASLVLTSATRVLSVGRRPGGGLALGVTTWERPSAIATDGDGLIVAGASTIWRLVDDGARPDDGTDARFVPQHGWITGDLGVHDVAAGPDRRPVVASTRFSCVATVDPDQSFRPLWKPPFVSALAPEDRCHLNGLAVDGDGRVTHVTAAAATDEQEGWRPRRLDGGVVLDGDGGHAVLDGLCLPNSPRWHDGGLWFCEAGHGRLCRLDPGTGDSRIVAEVDGLPRGLAFHGRRWAVVGLSAPRSATGIDDVPVASRLGGPVRAGVAVVDVERGEVVARLRLERGPSEVVAVVVLAGVRRPEVVAPFTDAAQGAVTVARTGRARTTLRP